LDIRDLFRYNWHCRRKFLKIMAEIPWETVTESCGGSFDSIRDIFVHSLQAEHVWIRRLAGKSTEGIYETPFSKFASIKDMHDYADEVEAETNSYLDTLTDEKLKSIFEFKGRDGKTYRHRVEDLLMHLVEEEIHHRGELLCIFWQHDIQPPYTSYTAYKAEA